MLLKFKDHDFEQSQLLFSITVSSYIKAYLDITSWWLQDYFRRCSSWLDIFIANVRYIIMRKVSGARYFFSENNSTNPIF